MHETEKRKWSHSVMSALRDPMYCSPPGSSVHGIFQARVLEWVAIAFSGKKLTISQMSAASTIGLVNQWVYSVEYFVTNKKCLWGKYLNNVQWKKGYTYLVGLLQEGGPLPGPNTELLSNTWKWIVQGDICADKQEILLGKGTQVESSRVREPSSKICL